MSPFFLLLPLLLTACKGEPSQPTDPVACGAPLTEDCVVTEDGCFEPNPLECSSKSFEGFRTSYLPSLRVAEQSDLQGWCHPGYIALCDDPNYFVTVIWLDSDGNLEFQINAVEGGECVGNSVYVPMGHICDLENGDRFYAGAPELESCMRDAETWVKQVYQQCQYYGNSDPAVPCDNSVCIVDATR